MYRLLFGMILQQHCVLNMLKKYNMLNLMSPSHSIDHTTGFSILNRLHNRLEREVDCSAKVMKNEA